MSVEFVQLADPQFGMFRALSRRTPERRAAIWRRFRRVDMVGDEDPFVPEGVTDMSPEAARLDEAVTEVNRCRPAFVVICGDLVNNIDEDDQAHAFHACITRLDPSIPLWCVPGNHDLSHDFARPTSDGLSAYRARFGPDYYSFELGETLFLALNSETLYGPGEVPGEDARQLCFAADTLGSARAREMRQVVVFMHRPLFVRAPGEHPLAPGSARETLYELLEAHPTTVTVFSGHLHQNRYVSGTSVEQVISGPVGFALRGRSGYRIASVAEGTVEHRYAPFVVD